MSEPFTVYLTRWCLSQGIHEVTAFVHPTNEFWVIVADGGLRNQIIQAGDWFLTREEAVKDAKKRLAKAQASARRNLSDLEAISFEEAEHEGTSNGAGEGAGGNQSGFEGCEGPDWSEPRV